MAETGWQIWIDTGGTFTDCLARDPDGGWHRAKVLSDSSLRGRVESMEDDGWITVREPWKAPQDFLRGFRLSFADAPEDGFEVAGYLPDERRLKVVGRALQQDRKGQAFVLRSGEEAPVLAARIVTGTPPGKRLPPMVMRLATTRGTNALLEKKGARTLLLITKGFADLLRIGTQQRPDLFSLDARRPEPLHDRVIEVDERLDASGKVLCRLDLEALAQPLEQSMAEGVTVAAVALLHSYRNPVHEQELAAYLRKKGFAFVSVSSSLAPLIKILPRAGTAIVDAYLSPVMERYLERVASAMTGGRFFVMTSAGGLVGRKDYHPKDSLLSGPAGGVVGAAAAGRAAGFRRLIPFDMGGTSTDVSRYDGDFDYCFEHTVGEARLVAPALKIESVAAGGGSICSFDGTSLKVGPESAGAEPGPACYGSGGPLTVTDVHVLMGRIHLDRFGIPVYPGQSREAFRKIYAQVEKERGAATEEAMLLRGFLDIVNERMAEAVRKISVREGYDPAAYTLVAFGGAGGLHACALATLLQMNRILFPADAGILSAAGLRDAVVERFAEKQLLWTLEEAEENVDAALESLRNDAMAALERDGIDPHEAVERRRILNLRLEGQDSVISLDYNPGDSLRKSFADRYRARFGYFPARARVEVASARVVVSSRPGETGEEEFPECGPTAKPRCEVTPPVEGAGPASLPCFYREDLSAGQKISGPAILQDEHSTLVVEEGWTAKVGGFGSLLLERLEEATIPESRPGEEESEVVELELFTNRFRAVADEMGQQLERTALSTNVKERRDFSCAVLDAAGELVVNAPHIPVHLGALGECVRACASEHRFRPGEVVVTNHPHYGGSHLPDVTVVTPVFMETGKLAGYVANRAHHAEIGGKTPGSMPPRATKLSEEGVVIEPFLLFEEGKDRFEELGDLLRSGPYPSRLVKENLADISAQVAANRRGERMLLRLVEQFGEDTVASYMGALKRKSERLLVRRLKELPTGECTARQELDDGTPLAVRIRNSGQSIEFDFEGTGGVHAGNFNATPAIVRSVVLYVLRLLVEENLPLNEGLMAPVTIRLPRGLLNPGFTGAPDILPAVVAGNVETSQRLVDTLLKALKVAACSQGTMNNLVFGNDRVTFYETIGGGTGATAKHPGADGVHSHMTNTAITDPEILELRYPVRLEQFAIRKDSGGAGRHRGGHGLVRRITFLESLALSLLTQHRLEGPFGLEGGGSGQPGRQYLLRADGNTEQLESLAETVVKPGDCLVIETPGGGGWGREPAPGGSEKTASVG